MTASQRARAPRRPRASPARRGRDRLATIVLGALSCHSTASDQTAKRDASATRDALFAAEVSGDATSPVCGQVSLDAGATVPFKVVRQIFDEYCISCHSPLADAGVDGAVAELDLTAADAWGDLVNQPAPMAESCGGTLVVPGNPDQSYLYQKVSSDHPCSGERMPRGDVAFALPDCVIAILRAWILQGAGNSRG